MDLKNHYKLKIIFFNSNFIILITNKMEVFGEIMSQRSGGMVT